MKAISVALTCGLVAALAGRAWGLPIIPGEPTAVNSSPSHKVWPSWFEEAVAYDQEHASDDGFAFPIDADLPKLSSPLSEKVPESRDWATDDFLHSLYNPTNTYDNVADHANFVDYLRSLRPVEPNPGAIDWPSYSDVQHPSEPDWRTDSGIEISSVLDNGSEYGSVSDNASEIDYNSDIDHDFEIDESDSDDDYPHIYWTDDHQFGARDARGFSRT